MHGRLEQEHKVMARECADRQGHSCSGQHERVIEDMKAEHAKMRADHGRK